VYRNREDRNDLRFENARERRKVNEVVTGIKVAFPVNFICRIQILGSVSYGHRH